MALPTTPFFVPRVRDAWRADYDTPILSRLSATPIQLRRHSADLLDTRGRQAGTTMTATTTMGRHNLHASHDQTGPLQGRSLSIGGLPINDSDDNDDEEKDDDGRNEMNETSQCFSASRDRDDFSVLMDFLKNTKPPRDNYMSIPPETFREVKERGRWSMLRRVGRRRSISLPKAPPPRPLILPDSAVSGITIGGHRHIAISIPLEAMPFADAAKSHCYDSSTRPYRDPDPDLLLPMPMRDRASRAAGAGAGAFSSTSLARPCRPIRSMSSTQIGQRANPPTYKSHERRNSQKNQGSCQCPEVPNSALCHMKMEHLQETGYPARRSSITASQGYTLAATADDAVPCHRNGRNNAPSGTHTFASYTWLPVSRGASPSRRSPHQPSPISEEPSGTESVGKKEPRCEGDLSISSITSATSGTYLGSEPTRPPHAQENATRLSPRVSIACRREKVRDKKRRDMEALRKAKEGKPEEVLKNSGDKASKASAPQLVLCPIQVVVNMEPVLLSAKKPESFNDKLQRLAEAHTKRHSSLSAESSLSSVSHRAPLSTLDGSPLPRQRQPKKTQAQTRPHHRGGVEEEAKTLRDDGHRRAGPSQQHSKESRTDRQILRLYDTYRENRIQDAERRIRKLEKNRDIWLQALIPLLDDMNQTIKAVNGGNKNRGDEEEEHPDGNVSFVNEAQVRGSNNTTAASTAAEVSEKKPRSGSGKKKSSKDMSLSQDKLVALLAQKFEDMAEDYDEDDEDDEDDADSWYERAKLRSDANGMVSMELLMEELAGEARRRQRRLAAEM